MDQLKAWLLERFQPVVLVAASPAAENICLQASGLTVVDLLRPTCTVNQLSGECTNHACVGPHDQHSQASFMGWLDAVPLRVGEFSTRIQEISLRFHAHNTIFQPKPEVRSPAAAAIAGCHSAGQACTAHPLHSKQRLTTHPTLAAGD
jgi:hypothetical protein